MPREPKDDNLDTETTFADMNVEGFKWYDPNLKKGKTQKQKVSKKEYWAMVKGAFAAYLPMFAIVLIIGALLYLLSYIWLTQ